MDVKPGQSDLHIWDHRDTSGKCFKKQTVYNGPEFVVPRGDDPLKTLPSNLTDDLAGLTVTPCSNGRECFWIKGWSQFRFVSWGKFVVAKQWRRVNRHAINPDYANCLSGINWFHTHGDLLSSDLLFVDRKSRDRPWSHSISDLLLSVHISSLYMICWI